MSDPRFELIANRIACVCRSTLLAGKSGLEQAKKLLVDYKQGRIPEMTAELWRAKKIVDSTLHPGTDTRGARRLEKMQAAVVMVTEPG